LQEVELEELMLRVAVVLVVFLQEQDILLHQVHHIQLQLVLEVLVGLQALQAPILHFLHLHQLEEVEVPDHLG
jgi:hypothetical protein